VRRISGSSLVVAAAVAVAALFVAVARAAGPEVLVAGDAHGLSLVRAGAQGHANPHKGPGSNLIYHNGPIMTRADVTAIFWGSSWGSPSSAGDKITGIDSFYGGVFGSHYLNTNTEYTGFNGQVTTNGAYTGHLTDITSAGSRDPGTSGVLAEVTKEISNPVSSGYYPVYTDIPRGNAGYCAWHSWGTSHGVMVQFAFFFRLDGDPGCQPTSDGTSHSEGLQAIAYVSGHELSEALTDPQGSAWYDRQGSENADKCAWQFSSTQAFTNGSTWMIQGNWSNAAAGCIWTK